MLTAIETLTNDANVTGANEMTDETESTVAEAEEVADILRDRGQDPHHAEEHTVTMTEAVLTEAVTDLAHARAHHQDTESVDVTTLLPHIDAGAVARLHGSVEPHLKPQTILTRLQHDEEVRHAGDRLPRWHERSVRRRIRLRTIEKSNVGVLSSCSETHD